MTHRSSVTRELFNNNNRFFFFFFQTGIKEVFCLARCSPPVYSDNPTSHAHSGVMHLGPLHHPSPCCPDPQTHSRIPLTLGLLPPMAPGRIEPVSWYRQRILETQPWETRSCREITQGRMPWWAISTILCRMWFGRGLPLMNTPPSWFTLPWPRGVDTAPQ